MNSLLTEVLLMHQSFFSLYCTCFSPICSLACVTSPAVNKKSMCTPDASGCPVMNCSTLSPTRPFSNHPNPWLQAQPLTVAGAGNS